MNIKILKANLNILSLILVIIVDDFIFTKIVVSHHNFSKFFTSNSILYKNNFILYSFLKLL